MKINFKIYKTSLLCLLLGAAQQVLAQSPGGVSTNLQRWYKPEAGITVVSGAVSDWQDQVASVSVSQATAANRPLYNSSSALLNFHPTIEFDGTNDRLTSASAGLTFGTAAHTFYYVASSDGTSASRWAFGNGASATVNGFNSGTAGTATSMQSGGTTFASKAGVWANGIPVLVRAGFNGGAAQPYYSSNNGTTEVLSSNVSPSIGTTNFSIGARPDGAANFWNGTVVEVIAYSGKHTLTDYNKVESYLALKYGINKTGSYVSSSGTTVWTSGGGYDSNVAGIARDDMGGAAHSGLNQKQGQSSNSGSHVVMALGSVAATNAANANTFSADQQFFLWGDDNASITAFVSTGNPTYPNRFTRIWKTQNTSSFAENITVYYPISAFDNNVAISTIRLLYGSTAASLSSGTANSIAQSGTTTINGLSYYVFSVPAAQVTNLQFFSFAWVPQSPGGVTGASLWVRADMGTSTTVDAAAVAQWNDMTVSANDALQVTASLRPTFRNNSTNNVNFNPVLNFNGSQYLTLDLTKLPTKSSARSVFSVATITSSAAVWPRVIAWGGSAGTKAFGVMKFFGDARGVIEGGLSTGVNSTDSIFEVGVPGVFSGVWAGSGGNLTAYSKYAVAAGPTAISWVTDTTGGAAIGTNASFFTPQSWIGTISEILVYPSELSNTDRQRIETYMAIKYGYTIDQSSPIDYIASDNTTVLWNATANSGFKNNICGIGRDDLSGLDQRQSQSINAGTQLVMSLGTVAATNSANTNTFSSDNQFFVWGDDGASASSVATTGNITYPYRLARSWKTQNTGSFAQGVSVYYPVSSFSNSPGSMVRLLYGSTAASLSDGSAATILQSGTATIKGVSYYVFSVSAAQVSNLQFFSFTTMPTTPGGVSGEVLWLRADAGTSTTTDGAAVSAWDDQSGLGRDAGNANLVSYRSGTNTKAINFNPVVDFDNAASRMYNITGGLMSSTSASSHFFLITGIPAGGLSSEKMFCGFSTSFGPTGIQGEPSFRATNALHLFSTGFGAGTLAYTPSLLGTKAMLAFALNPGASTLSVRQNGVQSVSLTSTTSRVPDDGYIVGDSRVVGDDNPSAKATVGEVFAYESNLSGTNLNKVESYLAIKYGMTLGTTASPVSYQASDGTVTWPGSSIYQNNVFGLGKNSLSALHQQISRSAVSGDSLVFSTDANFTNANGSHTAISGEYKFVIAGHDGASMSSLTALTTGSCPVDNMSRIAREWKVYATNSMDITNVQVNLSAAGFGNDVVMLVCSDSLFNTYTIVPGTFTKSTGLFKTKYSFADGRQFITFAGVPTTCAPCETGQLILKNAETWRLGGTAKRTANVITGVALGTVGSGAITANLRLLDPSGIEYQPTRNPGTYKGSWMMMRRYDNSTTAALTYAVKLSQPAKVDFQVARIIKASGQTTQVTFLGYCNGALVTAPTLSRVKNVASKNTYSIAGNVATGTRSANILNPYAMIKVNYTQPVDSIVIVFKMLRSPVRKVLRSIFVSNMNLSCSSPVEPSPDNVYMYQTFNTDTAYTCDTVQMQVKIKNLNCTNKVLNIGNTLPSGLYYNANSFLGDDVDVSASPTYSGTNFTLNGLVVPPGEHSYYVEVYHSGSIASTTAYKNQTSFAVVGGLPVTYYSDGNIATGALDSTDIVFKSSVPKVMPDSFIKTCDLSRYSTGGTLTYSFKFVNSSGSPITGLDFEDILDEQLTFQSATLSSSLSGTVSYTDDSASLTISNMTIPTGTTTFSIKVNVNSSTADTLYNYATLTETVESDCTGSSTRESNQVPTPRQLIDCILVNPRVSQRLKAP